jgi:hypothetical protein
MLTQLEVSNWASELFVKKNALRDLYKKYHPDKQGGSHDQFIVLRQILDAFEMYEPGWQTEMKTQQQLEELFFICKLSERRRATATAAFQAPKPPRFMFTNASYQQPVDDWYASFKAAFDTKTKSSSSWKSTKKQTPDLPSYGKAETKLVCGYEPCSKHFVKYAKHNKYCSAECRKAFNASMQYKKKHNTAGAMFV